MADTPEGTFRRLLELLLNKDMDGVAELWAEGGTAEFPFADGASPRRLDGREEIRGYLAGFPDVYDVREIAAVTVHHTRQPDTIVVEYTARGHSVRTGAAYRIDYIVVITVRDGQITRYRDYWSPLAVAAASGASPELLGSLDAGSIR